MTTIVHHVAPPPPVDLLAAEDPGRGRRVEGEPAHGRSEPDLRLNPIRLPLRQRGVGSERGRGEGGPNGVPDEATGIRGAPTGQALGGAGRFLQRDRSHRSNKRRERIRLGDEEEEEEEEAMEEEEESLGLIAAAFGRRGRGRGRGRWRSRQQPNKGAE